MQVTEQLIQKFFSGQCTGPEKLVVESYFAEFPEMLEEYLTERNWDNFHYSGELPARLSEQMFGRIQRLTSPRRKTAYWKYGSIAAAILVALGIWLLQPARPKAGSVAGMNHAAIGTAPESWKLHINTTTRMIAVSLADGSTAELQPGAELKYSGRFATANRNIYLKGDALFRVAAHSGSPFTVFAGNLSTVALGTVFRVTHKSDADVRVQLLQGRVVVKQINGSGEKENYLRPGQQLRWSSGIVSVQNIKRKTTENKRIVPHEIYHFDDRPVAEILKVLERNRGIKFIYADSLISTMRFTGVFNENKESVDDFIGTLCMLNALVMEKKNDTITILPDKR